MARIVAICYSLRMSIVITLVCVICGAIMSIYGVNTREECEEVFSITHVDLRDRRA